MKRIIILAVALFVAVTFNAEAKRHYHGVGGYFYTELAPYGSWIEVDYGVVVWRPTIIRVNWMPYQMGSWVWTYDGWYWDSYEPFGFITYHYGRWYYDDYYGWLWYPDYEWAPAWVEWRYDNNYIGWAPLHPYATFSISVGIFWSNVYYTPYYHWNYVTYNYFCDPYVYNYYIEPGSKYRIHSGTKYRHDYGYRNGRIQNRGIDVEYVRVRSGNEIRQRDIIRVKDSREINREGYGKRDEIRTLDINRDELMKNDLGRMEIKRENRKTSLDVEKVKIGKRENVSEIKKKDYSKDRTLDGVKTDQIRKDVKNGVDRIFENDKSKSTSNSDIISNKKDNNTESTKRKNEQIKNQSNDQIKNKNFTDRNENQVKQQMNNKKNETNNLNKQKNEQFREVKKENTQVTTNDQQKRNNVKEQSKSDVQKNRSNETKQMTDQKKEDDNQRERKKR